MRVLFLFATVIAAAVVCAASAQELRPIPMEPPAVAPPDLVVPAEPPGASSAQVETVRQAADPLPPTSPRMAVGGGNPPRSVTAPPSVSVNQSAGGFPSGSPGGTAPVGSTAGSLAGTSVEDGSPEPRPRLAEGLLNESLGPGTTGEGRPLALIDALANVYDARRQLSVVDAYWNASAALGNCFVRREVLARLDAIQPRPEDAAILRSARAAATASLREAELLVQEARYELAERVGLVPGGEPPLPSDRPHVGTYRTNADWILPTTAVFSRARLIDRLLPIRRQAIENRAAAVAEADAACLAASEAYRLGEARIDTLLAFLLQYSNQYRAFFSSVNEYNHGIVEYVVAVMQGTVPADRMVTMLIKPSSDSAPFRRDPNVEPAAASDAAGTAWKSQNPRVTPVSPSWTVAPPTNPFPQHPPEGPASPPSSVGMPTTPQPTLAPPESAPARPNWPTLAPKPDAPTLATPEDGGAPPTDTAAAVSPSEAVSSVPPAASEASEASETPEAPETRETPQSESRAPTPAPLEPVSPQPEETSGKSAPLTRAGTAAESPAPRTIRTANRPVLEESVYSGLAALEPGARAVQLAEILHWDHDLPEKAGLSITLADCLRRNLNPNRMELVRAYWLARQYAAERQLLAREIELLRNLEASWDQSTLGDLDRRRLATEVLAAKAAYFETEAMILGAQFNLTLVDGQAAGTEWLFPVTAPAVAPPLAPESTNSAAGAVIAQPYPGSIPVQMWSAENRARRRLTDLLSARYSELLERAAAVVEADLASAECMAGQGEANGSLESVLDARRRQIEATFDFLAALTSYNIERAEAVLQRFPLSGSTELLVRELGCQ